MTNRELLEFAAKAAGMTLYWSKQKALPDKCFYRNGGIQKPWNPLENDGDTQRLEVTLRIQTKITEDYAISSIMDVALAQVPLGSDSFAAARRAATEAAAVVGRSMTTAVRDLGIPIKRELTLPWDENLSRNASSRLYILGFAIEVFPVGGEESGNPSGYDATYRVAESDDWEAIARNAPNRAAAKAVVNEWLQARIDDLYASPA